MQSKIYQQMKHWNYCENLKKKNALMCFVQLILKSKQIVTWKWFIVISLQRFKEFNKSLHLNYQSMSVWIDSLNENLFFWLKCIHCVSHMIQKSEASLINAFNLICKIFCLSNQRSNNDPIQFIFINLKIVRYSSSITKNLRLSLKL